MPTTGDRTPAFCAACGQATGGRPCTNPWCHRPDREWSVVHSAGTYDGDLRRAIVDYKYRGIKGRGRWLADVLGSWVTGRAPWFEEYDLITGVPAYLGRGARRSWDPVARLLEELAPVLGDGWEVRPGLVRKTAETPPMCGARQWERVRIAEGSLRRSLCTEKGDLGGARVLVVDDVLTEGSTLREVARVLRRSGVDEVAGLVLARPSLIRVGQPPGRAAPSVARR